MYVGGASAYLGVDVGCLPDLLYFFNLYICLLIFSLFPSTCTSHPRTRVCSVYACVYVRYAFEERLETAYRGGFSPPLGLS